MSDTKKDGAGIDVISAVLDQINKLQKELNYAKGQHKTDMEAISEQHKTDMETISEQHKSDMETIRQQHKTDMETMQQVLDGVQEKHEFEMNMIREELKIVKKSQEINRETKKQSLNSEENTIIKHNGRFTEESETQTTERSDEEDIASGSVNTGRQTGLSGRQSGLTGNKARPSTNNHLSPSALEEIIMSGVDNGTDLNKIQAHIGGSDQGNA